MDKNLLDKVKRGVSVLFVLKIFTKILDFVLNMLVIRDVNPAEYGLFIFLV